MSRDTVLKDADGKAYSLDNITTQNRIEGQPSGVDACAVWLKERAVELFRAGKDAEAVALRKLADTMVEAIRPELERRAERHKKECPAEVKVMGDGWTIDYDDEDF